MRDRGIPTRTTAIVATLVAGLFAPGPTAGQSADAQSLYQFQAGQMMRFDVRSEENGEPSEGFYQISVEEAGSGQVQLRVEADVGGNACTTTSTVEAGPGVGGQMMMSCMALIPVAAALFAPTWTMFLGQSWTVGNSWTMGGVSMEVSETCSYAGVSGVRMVMREEGEERINACYSDALPLPLFVRLVTDAGSSVELTATAVERR